MIQFRASRLLHFLNISLRLSPYQSEIFAGLILLKASASHLIGVDGYGAVAKKTPENSKSNEQSIIYTKNDLSAPYHRLVKDPIFVNTLYK